MIKNNLKLSKTAWKIYYLLEKREKQQDEQGTFCIYPVKELSEQLHKGELTIKRALNELEEQKVIFRERQWGTDGQTAQKIYFHLKNQSITFEQSEFSGEETVLKNDTLTNQSQMNQSIIFEQSKFSGEEIMPKNCRLTNQAQMNQSIIFEQSKFSDEEIVLKSASPEAKEIFTGDSFEQSKFSDEEIVLKNVTPEPENEIQVIPNEVEVIPNSQVQIIPKQHIEKTAEQAKKLLYDMPNSSASHLMFDILSAGDSIADLPARKKQVNHKTRYEVKASGDKRLVSMENYEGTAKVTVELADINKLTKPAIMLLIYILVKANEQSLHNGKLTRDYISFPLQSLIDDGLYKTIRSARRGFLTGRDALISLQIKGQLQKRNGSKNAIKVDDLIVPFIKGGIENNQCYIYFNPYMDWEFFAQYFTKLPKYIFSLSDRAGILLYYIFYLARQHTREIASRGYFTISFRAIHSLLKLPSETNTQRHEQLIRKPIEDAVGEIESEHKQIYGNKEFLLELIYDEKVGISEYLDNGYLKVSLTGSFAEPFISQSQKQEKKVQQAEQKKARIEEKAIAMKMAKENETET